MRNISLLDCTLRDGGYLNDWEFGQSNIVSIYKRLVDSRVDIVEVGFIDDRRPFDINRSIYPDTASIKTVFENVTDRPPMVVGMIDYGTCDIDNVEACEDSFLDGIRVIFKKEKMHGAMEYCRQLKEKGYKVFSQLVSITAYEDSDLLELIGLVNNVEPYAVSIVDTYGLLEPDTLIHYYEMLDENVKEGVRIGFHAHNNFQLAYANSRAFVGRETNRDIIVDGTLFGMGKSAGNAPTELLGMYLNRDYQKTYNINSMLEAIEESIKNFYSKVTWGYKTFFYLSAFNKCHPSYVEYFQSKGNLSFSKLNNLLGMIQPQEKKLLYDKNLAEEIYKQYVADYISDEEKLEMLAEELKGRKVLVIGPGKNIRLQKNKVDAYIAKNRPVIISINYIPEDIAVDFVWVTKSNRYLEMTLKLLNRDIRVISTTNVECKNGNFAYVFGREPLLELKQEIKDNSFLMLLKILKQAKVVDIACAGLDGYSDKEDNYVLPGMEYDFVKQSAAHLNRHIRDVLNSEYENMTIEFITYSHYAAVEDVNSAAF